MLDRYPQFETTEQELKNLAPPVPLFHGIDATKLHTYKSLRCNEDGEQDSWDVVAFMFPHTGGLSTDVNRQVRSNQALLVGFFESCLEVSSASASAANGNLPSQKRKRGKKDFLRTGGRVVVTLFESAPYTLWNIRDLARHTGLRVVESFKFDWSQYPGYHHVRTLGTIEGGGGWKGEEREARMYVFEKVAIEEDEEEKEAVDKRGNRGTAKRGRGTEDEDSDD